MNSSKKLISTIVFLMVCSVFCFGQNQVKQNQKPFEINYSGGVVVSQVQTLNLKIIDLSTHQELIALHQLLSGKEEFHLQRINTSLTTGACEMEYLGDLQTRSAIIALIEQEGYTVVQ